MTRISFWWDIQQKVFQESNKTVGILTRSGDRRDKAAGPIIGPEHMEIFRRSGPRMSLR